jgi:cob(I)alamin adenosyltransferase
VVEKLRVDTAALWGMAGRWNGLAGELVEGWPPTGSGLSYQASAAAIHAARAAIARYQRSLVARMHAGATHVVESDTRYVANEAHSARELAAVWDA